MNSTVPLVGVAGVAVLWVAWDCDEGFWISSIDGGELGAADGFTL